MIVTTLAGLLTNLFVVVSGNTNNDTPISFSQYLHDVSAVNGYVDSNFYANYVNTDNNIVLYMPIDWETTGEQRYCIFYWKFNNGDNSSYPYYCIGGFGYNTTWTTNNNFRWYVPYYNSNDITKQSIDNLDVAITSFATSGTPYYDDANDVCFTSSIDYSVLPRNIEYGQYYLGGAESMQFVDEPSVGFGAMLSFSLGTQTFDADYYYQQGYAQGYSDGYDSGYSEGVDVGTSSGYTQGFTEGRTLGYQEGLSQTSTDLFSITGAIVDTPILILRSLFDYELFGTSIYIALLSLITLTVVIWVVRKFI